jgi:hypothetical protein
VEAFTLGPDGRTARLYDTFAANASPSATPTGQVLDLIGFHHFRRQLATSSPGGIVPASLAYDGHTVTWTQNGSLQSVRAATASTPPLSTPATAGWSSSLSFGAS